MSIFGLFGPPNIDKLKAKGDIQGLIKASKYQKDENIRQAALEALSAMFISYLKEKRRAAEALVQLVRNPRDNGQRGIYALEQSNIAQSNWDETIKLGAEAVEPLIAVLKDGDRYVREGAAEALGKIGDARAIEPLIAGLKDGNGYVREAAAEALEQIGWKPRDSSQRATYAIAQSNWDEAIKLGAEAVEPLIATIKNSDGYVQVRDRYVEVRKVVAEALGKIGDARAIEPLIAVLHDDDGYVREAAAEALGKIGDASAVEPLIAVLKDGDGFGRKEAAEALGKIGDARAVEPLIAAIKDNNSDVQRRAAEALGKIGDARAVAPLIMTLQEKKHEDIRRENIIWLGNRIDDDYSWTETVETNGPVRQAAAEALGQIGDARAVEPLITALKDSDDDVRKVATDALEKLGYKS